MEIIVFEKEAYYKMMGEMMSMFKNAVKEVQKEFQENIDWINPEEAMQLLNITGKTRMQELRNNGDIIYSKYGKKNQIFHPGF